jgi:uncharacterized protein (DUF433 family)
MNEYPGYKNRATFVASICLGDSIQKLREDYPEMTILDVKKECLEFYSIILITSLLISFSM